MLPNVDPHVAPGLYQVVIGLLVTGLIGGDL